MQVIQLAGYVVEDELVGQAVSEYSTTPILDERISTMDKTPTRNKEIKHFFVLTHEKAFCLGFSFYFLN